MASIKLDVLAEDRSLRKWCVPLREDIFSTFMGKGSPIVHKVFGDKSLFGPLLFKKFFDPSDAFPLWEFEPIVLLSNLQKPCVDWFQTDSCYILTSELPKLDKSSFRICVENGKIMEISGLWKHKGESRTDWRSGEWWEHGFVRRIELPEHTNWKKIEAYMIMNNDTMLDIRLPKTPLECDQGVMKESTSGTP